MAGERRGWAAGEVLVLDDSYVHSVSCASCDSDRYILLVHLWHPAVRQLGWEDENAAAWAG